MNSNDFRVGVAIGVAVGLLIAAVSVYLMPDPALRKEPVNEK